MLAGVIGTMPTAISKVSFDSVWVLSSVVGRDAEAEEVWSVLGGRRWGEAEVVLIHIEENRKNRNSPDPYGTARWEQTEMVLICIYGWGETRQKWSSSVLGTRD